MYNENIKKKTRCVSVVGRMRVVALISVSVSVENINKRNSIYHKGEIAQSGIVWKCGSTPDCAFFSWPIAVLWAGWKLMFTSYATVYNETSRKELFSHEHDLTYETLGAQIRVQMMNRSGWRKRRTIQKQGRRILIEPDKRNTSPRIHPMQCIEVKKNLTFLTKKNKNNICSP